AREGIVFGEARELVPVVVDGVDEAVVGTRQRPLELEVVGRIGEDEVDALVRQAAQPGETIVEDDPIEGHGGPVHPTRRRGRPGTRDLDPGRGADGTGTRNTHVVFTGYATDEPDHADDR